MYINLKPNQHKRISFNTTTMTSLGFVIVGRPNIICTFLIDYGSLQKILIAFFNFVWNTQQNKWTIFFECPGKMFHIIEKVFKKISEDQP